MIELSYDLHMHSCLSPCGDNDMTPENIAGMASLLGLEVIALTDHNTARNTKPFIKAAEKYGIIAIPGMEVTTIEEVHVVCLFYTQEDALTFDRYIYEHLIKIENSTKIFGNQYIIDENDKVVEEEPYLLINSTDISFDDMYDVVSQFNGVMIPAHIEKGSNSLLANLGFVPETSKFRTFELKDISKLHEVRNNNPYLRDCYVITDSDAHYLEHINEPVNHIYVKERTVTAVLDMLKSGKLE